jgi:hypothetical protein
LRRGVWHARGSLNVVVSTGACVVCGNGLAHRAAALHTVREDKTTKDDDHGNEPREVSSRGSSKAGRYRHAASVLERQLGLRPPRL